MAHAKLIVQQVDHHSAAFVIPHNKDIPKVESAPARVIEVHSKPGTHERDVAERQTHESQKEKTRIGFLAHNEDDSGQDGEIDHNRFGDLPAQAHVGHETSIAIQPYAPHHVVVDHHHQKNGQVECILAEMPHAIVEVVFNAESTVTGGNDAERIDDHKNRI